VSIGLSVGRHIPFQSTATVPGTSDTRLECASLSEGCVGACLSEFPTRRFEGRLVQFLCMPLSVCLVSTYSELT
jgi:hypothetical protein